MFTEFDSVIGFSASIWQVQETKGMFGGGGVAASGGGSFGGRGGDGGGDPPMTGEMIAKILKCAQEKSTVDVEIILASLTAPATPQDNYNWSRSSWSHSWSSDPNWDEHKSFPSCWSGQTPPHDRLQADADAAPAAAAPAALDPDRQGPPPGLHQGTSAGQHPPSGHTSRRTGTFYDTSNWLWTVDRWEPHHSRLVGKEHWNLGIVFF